MSIAINLKQITQNIQDAVVQRGISGICRHEQVKLVAVTKKQDIETIRQAIDAGVAAIGENRIQEAQQKYSLLERQVEWHLIGHLQTNKVKHAVTMFDLIHSVDTEKLAAEINRIAGQRGKRQDILLQVNVAKEETKTGLPPNQVLRLARLVSTMEHVRLCGLMTMAPYYDDAEKTRPVFRELYNLFGELCSLHLAGTDIRWLSMGMTNDYVVAVEEGANIVRIGTGIFGARRY